MNARARGMASGTVLRYAAAVIAILIVMYWFVSQNPYSTFKLVDKVDKDLIHLSDMANEACASDSYRARYTPDLNQGEVTFAGESLCIAVSQDALSGEKTVRRCTSLQCELYEERVVTLANSSGIWIEK